jgi:energy-coupling factor transporter ATP-binding protein EcfA2
MRSLHPAMAARLAALQQYKIKHAALEKMDDLLKNAIDEHTSYSILALYGPSGVGKSTVMKRIAEHCRQEEPDPSVVPVAVVQASPEDVGSAARLDFYRQVLQGLRGHVAVRDRILNLPLASVRAKKSTDPVEWLEMRDAVSYALDLLKVRAACIDEAQHLMQADAAHKPSIQLDWLKSLTNRSNLLYILVGNFSLYDFCHLNGQLARRVREEQFCRYHLDQQDDAVEFTSALKVLLEQVPLQVNIPEMLTHWKWFGEWSIGCIGILSDWVVETASTLCRAGETVLTLEALAKHALKPAQRLKLETEARTGEFKIEEAKKESERELQRLLGKPSTVPMSALPHPPLGTSAPTAPLSSPSHTSSHIERASYRDPVGEQIIITTSTKCTYLGEISVARLQFQEAGTTCVECPTCGARRTLKSPKDRPHFPSHPRRLTPPPKGERRWIEREGIWKVVED